MDYINQTLGFKIRKVLRYFRLYGVRRTLTKVHGAMHVRRKYDVLPVVRGMANSPRADVGIIGCGNYAFSTIAFYLAKIAPHRLRGVMDTDIHRAASLFQKYGALYYTDDAQRIISDARISLVFIASNHASHAEYAIRCINAGKHVHIEKPHVVTEEQLRRLEAAMSANPSSRVFLGFNRPRTHLFGTLQRFLSQESGSLMINWFVAGHEISERHWYYSPGEGGRVLGNLCHWSDLTLSLVGIDKAFPCEIIPGSLANSKCDFAVSIIFADGSCASITFSAKGHTFEGVHEILNVHKGDVVANLSNFQRLTVHVRERKRVWSRFFRDHGHMSNIFNSLSSQKGEDPRYVIASARLFLALRRSLENRQCTTVSLEISSGSVMS